jgi:HK97 family phage prohead protease
MAYKTRQFNFEVKGLADDGTFEGYASVFGVLDDNGDIVETGAFTATLERHAKEGTYPAMLYGHSMAREIGEWLSLKEDERGLYGKGKLWIDGQHPDPDALKAYRGMKKKNGKMGLSIGYMVPDGGAVWDEKSKAMRIKEVELYEVSPVLFPANRHARVEAVKNGEIPEINYLEDVLREAGLSRSKAKAILAKGYSSILPREAEDEALVKSLEQLIQVIKS